MTTGEVVGREAELAELDRFLDAVPSAPAALVLEGGAGIGKTTLWREGVRRARERSYRVLVARPARSETQLSFSGLTDLLGDVLDEVLPRLPSPQQRALGIALLRVEAGRVPPDARTIALAFRSCLTELAKSRPLVVAVDDLQWLDPPSASALEYAAQRLGEAPVGLLPARRVERREPIPLALDRSLAVSRLELGPLSLGALHELLRDRLEASFSRPVLLSLYQTSGGNPFFALELAQALLRHDEEIEPGAALPVPDRLHELLLERLRPLPPDVQDALAVLSAQAKPNARGVDGPALDVAVAAGIVVVEGNDVRFSHPLLAAAAYELADSTRKREIHASLARDAGELEVRARHLALAAKEQSEPVAAVLDEAASHAAARGAPYAAAELAELASSLTPDNRADAERRRRLVQATHLFHAGDAGRARGTCEQLLSELPSGPERAEVLVLLAETREDDLDAALALGEEAIAHAADDPALNARAHDLVGRILLIRGDFWHSRRFLLAGVDLAACSGDDEALALLIGHTAHNESLLGRYTPGLLERGVALERKQGILLDYGPTFAAGLRAMYADRLDEARKLLEEVKRAAVEGGVEPAYRNTLLHLAELECRAGDLDAAERAAAEALERAEQIALVGSEAAMLYVRALTAALRGEVETTRHLVGRGLELVPPEGIFFIQHESVLGFLELSLGDTKAAARHLRPLPSILDRIGYGEPSVNRVLPNAIETLVQLGELGEARPLVDKLEERGRSLDSPWSLATGARCRGLLLAGEGNLAGAIQAFRHALVEHERMTGSFERGRTLLALGATERRLRRQRAARESLEAALEVFEQVGTPLWAAKTRDELARIGGRAPSEDRVLSETEWRIVELVSGGMSNKEVAARLFVTVRTVESNLTRVYAKLGIRRRTELAPFMNTSQEDRPHL